MGPAYSQGVAMVAALKQVLQRPLRETNSKRQCFNFGKMGHMARDCKQSQGQRNVPGLRLCCQRGNQWVWECQAQDVIHGPPPLMQQETGGGNSPGTAK